MTPKINPNDPTPNEPVAPDRTCENCGRWIDVRELLYHVKLEMFAEKTLDLDAPSESLGSAAESLEEIISLLSNMNDEQVREATDQVYERFQFNLCQGCRKVLHLRILQRKNLLSN